MSDAEILFETMGRVALIRLNRPQQLNALTHAMLADIRRLVGEAEKDPEVTAIAFVGEGRGFCSGLDAEVLRQTTQAGESRRSEGVHRATAYGASGHAGGNRGTRGLSRI